MKVSLLKFISNRKSVSLTKNHAKYVYNKCNMNSVVGSENVWSESSGISNWSLLSIKIPNVEYDKHTLLYHKF